MTSQVLCNQKIHLMNMFIINMSKLINLLNSVFSNVCLCIFHKLPLFIRVNLCVRELWFIVWIKMYNTLHEKLAVKLNGASQWTGLFVFGTNMIKTEEGR